MIHNLCHIVTSWLDSKGVTLHAFNKIKNFEYFNATKHSFWENFNAIRKQSFKGKITLLNNTLLSNQVM